MNDLPTIDSLVAQLWTDLPPDFWDRFQDYDGRRAVCNHLAKRLRHIFPQLNPRFLKKKMTIQGYLLDGDIESSKIYSWNNSLKRVLGGDEPLFKSSFSSVYQNLCDEHGHAGLPCSYFRSRPTDIIKYCLSEMTRKFLEQVLCAENKLLHYAETNQKIITSTNTLFLDEFCYYMNEEPRQRRVGCYLHNALCIMLSYEDSQLKNHQP